MSEYIMNIGIDGYEANIEKRVGIGQYAYQLLRQLHDFDKGNNYTVFLPQPPLPDMPGKSKNWRYLVGRPGPLWTILQLPKLITRVQLDVFFSPTHYGPWFSRLPQVLSVMDLSYLHFPEMFQTQDLLQLKYMGAISIKRAKKILTISEFSRREISKHYDYPKNDIEVTYPGFKSKIKNQKSKVQIKIQKLAKKYILFVGTIQPRKNIVRLVEAFEMLNIEDMKLVIVGKKGWLYEPILKRLEVSPKKERIIYLDFVSDEDLSTLYKNAACFCLPSLYEGFGIPVAEALSFGCPVVVSQTSSLPEVAGMAGIYVDPLNSVDIAQGIKKALLLSQSEREELNNKGKEQIKKFTWEKCARKTIKVYESLT